MPYPYFKSLLFIILLIPITYIAQLSFRHHLHRPAPTDTSASLDQVQLIIQYHQDQKNRFQSQLSDALKQSIPSKRSEQTAGLWPWIVATCLTADCSLTALSLSQYSKDLEYGLWLGFFIFYACYYLYQQKPLHFLFILTLAFWIPQHTQAPSALFLQLIYFITWKACTQVLKKNNIEKYAILGFLFGLYFLAWQGALALTLCFVIVITLRWTWAWLMTHWPKLEHANAHWVRRNHWVGLILLSMVFMLTISPICTHPHTHFRLELAQLPQTTEGFQLIPLLQYTKELFLLYQQTLMHSLCDPWLAITLTLIFTFYLIIIPLLDHQDALTKISRIYPDFQYFLLFGFAALWIHLQQHLHTTSTPTLSILQFTLYFTLFEMTDTLHQRTLWRSRIQRLNPIYLTGITFILIYFWLRILQTTLSTTVA
jgi:hypothetical protein